MTTYEKHLLYLLSDKRYSIFIKKLYELPKRLATPMASPLSEQELAYVKVGGRLNWIKMRNRKRLKQN